MKYNTTTLHVLEPTALPDRPIHSNISSSSSIHEVIRHMMSMICMCQTPATCNLGVPVAEDHLLNCYGTFSWAGKKCFKCCDAGGDDAVANPTPNNARLLHQSVDCQCR